MLRSLAIHNSRCFEELQLKHFERVNLIAGRNNVGKTALLLHLAGNNPQVPGIFNQVRSIDATVAHPWTWRLLFWNSNVDRTIVFETEDSMHRLAKVSLRWQASPLGSLLNLPEAQEVVTEQEFEIRLAYEEGKRSRVGLDQTG